VSKAPITTEIHQALDIHGDLGSEFAFHLVFTVDNLPDVVNLGFRQIVGSGIPINFQPVENLLTGTSADPEYVSQTDFDPFISG
jgi:hypothetical protein